MSKSHPMNLDPRIVNDASVMRLAHPQRLRVSMGEGILEKLLKALQPGTTAFLRELFDSSRSLPQVQSELMTNPRGREMLPWITAANGMESATGTGGSAPFFGALRQWLSPAPYFMLDDALLDLLQHTDIADDIPVSHLHMPYGRIFIEFGRRRSGLPQVPNAVTTNHPLESAYLEIADDKLLGRHLSVMFVGSPLGHANSGDDATLNMALPLGDPERPLNTATELSFDLMIQASRVAGWNVPPLAWVEQAKALMQFLVKCLLYIGMPDVRRELKSERTELLEELKRLKSPGKRAKLERRLFKAVDYILVKAPDLPRVTSAEETSSRTVKTHWRRGHLRSQRYGPQWSLSRVIFIAPVLVGTGEGAPAPVYKVV